MLCVMSLSLLTLTPARTRGVVGRADKENSPVDCFRRETAQSKERPKRKARHSATMRRRRGNASSSLVTQTSSEVHNEPPNFLYFTGFFGLLGVCTVSKTSAIFLPKIGSKSGTTTCLTTFVTKKLYSIRFFDTLRFSFYAK